MLKHHTITKILTLALLLIALVATGCSSSKNANGASSTNPQVKTTEGATPTMNNKKVPIAYYSWGGNTRAVAQEIHKQVGGDIVEIVPEKPYSETYAITVAKAKQEQLTNARPAVKTKIDNFADYDTVYIGYPNWWGSMPMHIATFVESYNWDGKKVVPFFTHGGGGIQNCEKHLKERIKGNATFAEALVLSGSSAKTAQGEIAAWLKKVN